MTTISLEKHRDTAERALPEPFLLIGGEKIPGDDLAQRDRINPSTGELLGTFPIAGPEEVDQAVKSAWKAFPAWRRMGADQRRALLLSFADVLKTHEAELAQIHALETGATLQRINYAQARDHFQYYAGWVDKIGGELVPTYANPALDYVKYEPYGVIGALATWNGPITSACMKLAPALAAGNCIVLKSPDYGPFAIMRMIELFQEAGLPDGVVNLVSGNRHTTQAMIAHPGIRKISFTGGPGTAKAIMTTAAQHLKPVTMELGGKSANVVFADADLDAAANMATRMSTIFGSGQGCLFPTRLLVEEAVYEEMLDRVTAVAESVRPGDPLDPDSIMGPVIDAASAERIDAMVTRATANSSVRLLTGGKRIEGPGCFYPPTVLADVEHDAEISQEEVFGPILVVDKFCTEEEAITRANDTAYGLAAYVHTADYRRAHRVADEFDAGWIGVNGFPPMQANAPFGGIKESGFGREGGRAGIEEYLHHKNIYMPLN